MSIPVQCQSFVDQIMALEQERSQLQADLRQAPPPEKPALASQVRALNRQLAEVQDQLADCIEIDTSEPILTTDALEPNETLAIDQSLVAPSGFGRLTLQTDGNLVLYCQRPQGWVPRWATDTWGQPVDTCIMQTDGNLVLYDGSTPVWSSNTWTFPGARLVLQDDENLVIYHGTQPVWATNTSLDGTPIKGEGPRVYHLLQGVRHWIPDPETLERSFGGWGRVSTLSEAQLAQWPEGDAVPSVLVSSGDVVNLCYDRILSGPALPERFEPPPPPRILSDGSTLQVTRQPLVGVTAKMWDVGATLRVKMMGGTPLVRGKVRQYAEEWTRHANIRFDFVDGPAEIKIAFDPGGSWSAIGRDALWVPFEFATMNFGWFNDSTIEAEFRRVILHEFGHALGLGHEHQSPAAGIAWDREKVYAQFAKTQGWDRGMVDANVFDRFSVTQTNYSAFDPNSIMLYSIPASLTLDGMGVSGGTSLSATDIEYIQRWYPFAPMPAAARGLLRTGDDCDEIDFLVDYGVASGDAVEFSLTPASGLTWWKAIEVPVGSSGYQMFQMQDGNNAAGAIARSELDVSRPIRFWKAKAFGIHTRLNYTWDVLTALPAGSRLSLTWKRDRC
jgi:serralysin